VDCEFQRLLRFVYLFSSEVVSDSKREAMTHSPFDALLGFRHANDMTII